MRLLNGLASPLASRTAADIDMICVRENSEGEYAGVGGRIHRGTPHEVANQTGVFTRRGIERILRYGFELAAKRPRQMLASATKSNALTHSMVLWDEVAQIVRKDFPAYLLFRNLGQLLSFLLAQKFLAGRLLIAIPEEPVDFLHDELLLMSLLELQEQ